MKLLTRNTDYAVRAVCYLARNDKRVVPVPELVKELKMPRPFLRKILQTLNLQGLIRSYRGAGGGFMLARPPSRILLSDLWKSFQGPLRINECIFKKRICPNKDRCALKEKIDSIERYVESELNATTIASLMR